MAGVGLGAMLMPQIALALIDWSGWRGAYLDLAPWPRWRFVRNATRSISAPSEGLSNAAPIAGYGPDSIASKGKLASATKTIRNGLFCRSFLIQLAMGVGLSFMWRMTAVAPTTSNLRSWKSRGIFPERGRARALTLCCPAVGRNERAA
jgi:hypothetical protein